jgi:hypothetical protein
LQHSFYQPASLQSLPSRQAVIQLPLKAVLRAVVRALTLPRCTHGSVLYPDPQSGDQVSWEQTVAMLNNGEVKEVLAGQNLQLTVSLKDGRSLKSSIPPEEDLQKTIEKCGDACKDVVVK